MSRGRVLTDSGARFLDGGVATAIAPLFARVLDRVDRGLAEGRVLATLPDGSPRTLGGRAPGPTAVVDLRSWRALVRLALSGSVGWYVAWDRGEWASPDPVPLFDLFMRNRVTLGQTARARGPVRWANAALHWLRRNSPAQAQKNISAHYDLGNDFYSAWLDAGMNYSSAIWGEGDDLEAAQRRKIAALLDRLALKSGDRLLEIGCGWGPVLEAASERGAGAVGITLSREQLDHARRRVPTAEIRLQDYRDVRETFDALASVEMVEAVGQQYWPAFLDMVARCLKPGGRAALQFIAIEDDVFDRYAESVDFIQTYVFPGGLLLSKSRFRALAEERGLIWHGEQAFGIDYARTLAEWRGRFDAAAGEGRLPPGFDDRFVRMWRYYLMYCEGGFRGGGIDVMQVTLTRS